MSYLAMFIYVFCCALFLGGGFWLIFGKSTIEEIENITEE